MGKEHQRKVKMLKDRFYRTREIDRSGFDGLYQELRECGYWAKAEYVRELEGRFVETLRREEEEQVAKVAVESQKSKVERLKEEG